jgi:hypothetical protein
MSINLKPIDGHLDLKVKDPTLWLVTTIKLTTKVKSDKDDSKNNEILNNNKNQNSNNNNIALEIKDNK